MMPEPTTVASKNAMPTDSENARCAGDGISSFLWPSPWRGPSDDLLQLFWRPS
jgi:hypothetical protein